MHEENKTSKLIARYDKFDLSVRLAHSADIYITSSIQFVIFKCKWWAE